MKGKEALQAAAEDKRRNHFSSPSPFLSCPATQRSPAGEALTVRLFAAAALTRGTWTPALGHPLRWSKAHFIMQITVCYVAHYFPL